MKKFITLMNEAKFRYKTHLNANPNVPTCWRSMYEALAGYIDIRNVIS